MTILRLRWQPHTSAVYSLTTCLRPFSAGIDYTTEFNGRAGKFGLKTVIFQNSITSAQVKLIELKLCQSNWVLETAE